MRKTVINRIVDHKEVGTDTDQGLNKWIRDEGMTPLTPLTLASKGSVADAQKGHLVEYKEALGEVT